MAKHQRNDGARLKAAVAEMMATLERYDVGGFVAVTTGEQSESFVDFRKDALVDVVETADGASYQLMIEDAQKRLKKKVFERRLKSTYRQLSALSYLAGWYFKQLSALLEPGQASAMSLTPKRLSHWDLMNPKPEDISPEDLPPAYFGRRP